MNGTTTTPSLPHWLTPRRLDRAEQAVIVALWLLLVFRVWQSSAGNPFAPLMLLTETTVLLFVLLRRPTEAISMRFGDWLLAITATAAPMLIMPVPVPDAMVALGSIALGLVAAGNAVQLAGKMFLRRSFGVAPANRGIKTTGMYRLVRHPIYAGYLMVHIGLLMMMPSLMNIALYAIGWWAQILRLQAEETLLSQDPQYRAFMQKTRWRLVPGVF
ncbi:MAG: methyltransferase [Novosphingobium sp.]|uniref:methyltransferase family protein n=1 Tax=Novosphingobium sp. TaxID=1874826 RepID=UPI0032BB08FB